MKTKGILFTVLSALLFGVTPVLTSLTYEMGSTPVTVTFYRNLMAIPVFVAVMLIKKIDFRLSWKTLINIAVIGIIGCGITTLLLYSSYQYIGIGTSTTLHFLYPMFVALLCRIFYKERLGLQKILALSVAGGGILFFMEFRKISNGVGILMAVISGLTYSLYMVGIEKFGLKDISPYKVSLYISIAVSAALLLYNIPTGQIVFNLPPKALLYTFAVSICTSFLAVALLQLGIKYLGATTSAIFCLFEPVAGMISGAVFLHEPITLQKAAGCFLIIAAVTVLIIRFPRKKKDPLKPV